MAQKQGNIAEQDECAHTCDACDVWTTVYFEVEPSAWPAHITDIMMAASTANFRRRREPQPKSGTMRVVCVHCALRHTKPTQGNCG